MIIQLAIEIKHIIICIPSIDNTLMIYDLNKIYSEQIMSYTNSLHTNLQFKPTHEISNTINFLELLIYRNTHVLDTYLQKPHLSSNHPMEHKLASYRYLIDGMLS